MSLNQSSHEQTSLRELGFLFIKLGMTSFGGPAVHIAMMKEEVVERRNWLTESEFLDYLGATNLIPGPNSTELAIHIGYHRRGWPGLLIAGACFILPAVLIVWAIAGAYVQYGSLPQVSAILYGIKPVVIAVVFQALWGLGHTAIKSFLLAALSALALALTIAGFNEVAIIFAAGLIMMILRMLGSKRRETFPNKSVLIALLSPPATKASAAIGVVGGALPIVLPQLFLIFLKIGSVLFGSGYVLVAFLQSDLVEGLHWITQAQLLDAVAVGQFTPGPVFTTVTFIGYIIAGNAGALLATLGIFLPAFFFVAVSAPLIPKLRRSFAARAFLDGVNVASLALMVVVTWQLGRSALVDFTTVALALTAGFCLIRYKLNSAWLVLAGGIVGFFRL
ncbi:MAG: chromate efflux transporter [Bdellovibrionia bacterium]